MNSSGDTWRATWMVGWVIVAVVALGLWMAWGASVAGLGLLLLVLAWGLVGLGVGLWELVRSDRGRRSSSRPAPEGAAPADGRVGRARMDGVRAAPNAEDSRWGRFEAFEPRETASQEAPTAEAVADAAGASTLLGRVVIVSLFVGRDGRSWSDAEIARTHRALERAGVWLEREAMRWGAAVNIDLADTYFAVDDPEDEAVEIEFVLEGDHQAPFEAKADVRALASASRASARLGFADAVALFAEVRRRLPADRWVWLVHQRRAGRSLAVPQADSDLPGVALAVCYAREATLPEPLRREPFPDPTTFAHELMHLFGASDKYGVSLRSFPARSVTERDVMRLSIEVLSRLRVDPLTAQEIGWTETLAPPVPGSGAETTTRRMQQPVAGGDGPRRADEASHEG